MKQILLKIFIALLVLTTVFSGNLSVAQATDQPTGSAVQPIATNQGNATISSFLGFPTLVDMLSSSMSGLVNNIAVPLAGLFLGFCGFLLDGSISLSLNIKNFIDSTPSIFSTWKILRDLSGLFFIFYLLYAAAQLIVSQGSTQSYGSLIKNIVIAGILVNFSFSIIGIGIDASNIVSLTIYKAMNPTHKIIKIDPNTKIETLIANNENNGISSIFMNGLRIQQIYDASGNRLGGQLGDPIKVALIGIAGVGMMITTGLSFILAAFAFIARTIILIFLITFSSIYFTSWVIPEIKKHLGFFSTQLKNQLLFMPVYMLLTYVGLTIINGSNLLVDGRITNISNSTTINWIIPYIIILINFTIVIAILNMPLMVGLAMGGWSTSLISDWTKKFNALSFWKGVGNWSRTTAWNQTGSRAANYIGNRESVKNFAAKSGIGQFALTNLNKAGKSYSSLLDSQVKARTDFANSLGYDEFAVEKIKKEAKELLREEQFMEQSERSRGNIVAANMHKNNIENIKKQMSQQINSKKKERQTNYAERIESRFANPETLFMKIARKNKVAAAKINIDIWQKQLDKKKEELGDLKKDLKVIETDIRREEAAGRTISPRNATARDELKAKIARTARNEANGGDINEMGVEDIQDLIDEAKLIK